MGQEVKNKIEQIISNQDADEKEILLQLKQLINEAELQNNLEKNSRSITELVSENILQLQSNTRESNIIKTGFTEFDRMFGGFSLGEFVVIGARPANGKTQLLINLSLNISTSSPVLYFTFDLSEFLLTSRFISSFTGIAVSKILENELEDYEKAKLASLKTEFAQHKILVNDCCKHSITALKAHCQKQIQENGVKVIIIDYLQMMSSNKYRNNREAEISYITSELKNIAKDFNVCVIVSSQLSRAIETRSGPMLPQLSDLRDSGSIEQNADKVIFINRPEYYGITNDENGKSTFGLIHLILAKNKIGGLGMVKLMRDPCFTNFQDFEEFKHDFTYFKSRLSELTTK
jgi:replicative DNA helicase